MHLCELARSVRAWCELARSTHCEVVKFVRNWSGGLQDPTYLHDIEGFMKTLRVARDVPAAVLGSLGELDLGPGVGAEWRAACVKAMAAASDKHVTPSGESKYISSDDVLSMHGRNKPFVPQAQRIMATGRDMADPIGLGAHAKATLLGALDVRLVAHVFQRPLLGSFRSMGEVGHSFYRELAEQARAKGTGAALQPCPKGWSALVAATDACEKKREHGNTSSIATLKRDGSSALALAADKGLVVGARCSALKELGPALTVVTVTTDMVELETARGEKTLMQFTDFFATYKLLKSIVVDATTHIHVNMPTCRYER